MRLSPDMRKEEADKLLDEKGGAVSRWLTSEKLDWTDEERRPHWGSLLSHFKSLGKLKEAQGWIASQEDDLVRIWGVTKHKRLAKHLCHRFVRAKMDKHAASETSRATVLDDNLELDLLPAHLRWVAAHPGLLGAEEDVIRKAEAQAYEEQNPAPNHAAKNLYLLCRKDDKHTQKMFDEVNKILLEHRKRTKEKTVSEQDQKEQGRILDMKAELAKMLART